MPFSMLFLIQAPDAGGKRNSARPHRLKLLLPPLEASNDLEIEPTTPSLIANSSTCRSESQALPSCLTHTSKEKEQDACNALEHLEVTDLFKTSVHELELSTVELSQLAQSLNGLWLIVNGRALEFIEFAVWNAKENSCYWF